MTDQPVNHDILTEAIAAAKRGERATAKDQLTRYLRYDQKNELAWLWMSSVVESDRERLYCLNQVLKLNPENRTAKRGLAMLGALSPDQRTALNIEVVGVGVEHKPSEGKTVHAVAAASATPRPGFSLRRNRRMEILAIGALLGLLLICGGLAVFRDQLMVMAGLAQTATPAPPTLTPTSSPMPTLAATAPPATAGVATPAPDAALTPIALRLNLPETFTPTPQATLPFFPEEEYRLGQRAYEAGNLGEAAIHFIKAATDNQSNYAAHYYLGQIYLQQKDNFKAFNEFNAVLKINPNHALSYLGRGRAIAGLGANPLKDYDQAKANDPRWVEPYIEAARYYVSRKDIDKAIGELEAGRTLDSSNVTVLWNLAEQYYRVGRYEDANGALKTALAIDPTAIDLYRVQAEVAFAETDYDTALTALNMYMTYRADDAEGWRMAGQTYLAKDDANTALLFLTRALELKPNDPRETWVTLGEANLKLNNPDTARKNFDQALRLGATTSLRLRVGQAYYDAGDYEAAATEFKKAVDGDRGNFAPHYWLGLAYLGGKAYDNAVKSLANALDQADADLERFDVLFARAKSYKEMGETDNAVADLRSALGLNVADRAGPQLEASQLLTELGGPASGPTQTPTSIP